MEQNNTIFTFWEGRMPEYIELCMKTWKFPYVLLNYKNLNKYTNLPVTHDLTRFALPKVANCVRAHVLRDHGGYWLDTDTIMVNDKLPDTTVIGYPEIRSNSIGYLYADRPHMDMFEKWSEFQDKIINNPSSIETHWSFLSNDFTDPYVKEHEDVTISNIENCWPETYMVQGDIHRQYKYEQFYFDGSYHLSDIRPTDMLMLHNSWTPEWYKKLSEKEVLSQNCTLSNILKEVLS